MQLMPDTLADVRTGHVTLMNFSKKESVPVLIFPPDTIRNQMLRKLAQNSVWRRYEMPVDETLPLNKYRLKHIVEKPANPKSHLVIANMFIPHNTIVKLHDTPQPKKRKAAAKHDYRYAERFPQRNLSSLPNALDVNP